MAKMCARDSFPIIVIFSFLSSAIFTLGETFSQGVSNADDVIARERRDVLDSFESLLNLKVFDPDAEYQGADNILKDDLDKISMPLKDGSNMNVTISIPTDVAPPVLCHGLQVELGRYAAEFVECAVMNSRPISLCLGCVAPYNSTVNAYRQIMDASENSTKCKDILFGKDRLEIAQNMYDNVVNLWSEADCDTCFGTPDLSVVSDQTLNFFEVLMQVRACFEDIKSFSETVNDASNSTCTRCKPAYEHLGSVYASIVSDLINDQPTEQVCADIADAMNITRHLWNNQFKCKMYGTEVGYVMFVLTGSLSALPILFYLAAKILSNAETIHLVLSKRKFQDITQVHM